MKSVRNLNRILNQSRRLASVAGGSGTVNPYTVGPFQVFDRNAKRLQKDRAVSREEGARSRTVDYVRDEVADRLVERFLVGIPYKYFELYIITKKYIQDIKRTFNSVVDLGAGSGHLTRLLEPESVKKSIMLDMSRKLLFIKIYNSR